MYRPPSKTEDGAFLSALRHGDESAFAQLVDRYHGSLLRLAMAFVPSQAIAEEVVQETWIAVLEGLHRFEGRSSLKAWIFRILTNQAKTRGARERRAVPFSLLGSEGDDRQMPPVDPDRFLKSGPLVGHWSSLPNSWDEGTPERLLLSKECGQHLEKAIGALPSAQRQVLILRDVDGLTSAEICNVLGISETNLRVVLHRARAQVRRILEQYLEGGDVQA